MIRQSTGTLIFLGLVVTFALIVVSIPVTEPPQVYQDAPGEALEPNGQYMVNATCYVHTGNHTFSGTHPESNRTVAIRFNSHIIQNMDLGMGDRIYIEGMGTYIVEDRIPDYQEADLDIFMANLEECKVWGRQDLIIEKL